MSTEQAGVGRVRQIGRRMMGQRVFNRRPSVLLLVVVKPASARFRIVLPIPVALITVLVETLGFWGSVFSRLGVRLPGNAAKALPKASRQLSRLSSSLEDGWVSSMLSVAPKALEELWLDLISQGSWSLVDVKSSGGDTVLVRFI